MTDLSLVDLQRKSLLRIVDDDAGVRDSYRFLLQGEGWTVRCYGCAEEFLAHDPMAIPGCMLLDIRMGGMSGLELQEFLLKTNRYLPIIFISAHGSIREAVKTVQRGAVDFLTKPIDEIELLQVIEKAIRFGEKHLEQEESHKAWNELSVREKEVIRYVAEGWLNKQIAEQLGISERTVQVHRAKALHKLKLRTSAEVASMLVRANILP